MKAYKFIIAAIAALAFSSCVGDLNVTPIDPSVDTPETVLSSEADYIPLLAKCYQGLCVSGSDGANGGPDIDGIDGGFGQYMRALFYMNEYTTDEATCPWNDATVRSLHGLSFTASDVFVTAMFSRIFYQISVCNEFIRKAKASGFADSANMQTYIDEARALRALSYYHAIDMFGSVPFTTEDDAISVNEGPDQKKRPDLFTWIDDECKDLIENGHLMAKSSVYGRLDVNFVKMIRAHLNLNARVYLDLSDDSAAKSYYDVTASLCKEILAAYPKLHSVYTDLFCADNDTMTDEIIFAVQSDPTNTQSWGNTTFLLMGSLTGNDAVEADHQNLNKGGWGGINVTPTFIDKFDDKDARKLFWGEACSLSAPKELEDIADFKSGWHAHKYSNVNHDGSKNPLINDFPYTDNPLFRSADAYLMLAEAQLRGASTVSAAEAKEAWNAVRTRAGLDELSDDQYTLNEMIDERGRELYHECWRRSDLIRFGLFTGSDYLWTWKGGVYEGQAVDKRFNLMPLPTNEINTNSKLQQNPGYAGYVAE